MLSYLRKHIVAILALVAATAALFGNLDRISSTFLGYPITPFITNAFDSDIPIGYVLLVEAAVPPRPKDAGLSRGGSWSVDRPLPSMVSSNFERILRLKGYKQLSFEAAKNLQPGGIVRVSADEVMILTIDEVNSLYKRRRDRSRIEFTPSGVRTRGSCLFLIDAPINYKNQTVFIDDVTYNSYWVKVADDPCPT